MAIYVVQIIDTPHNIRSYVAFMGFAFYIAGRCGFDKHLYLTSCLNGHNDNTYMDQVVEKRTIGAGQAKIIKLTITLNNFITLEEQLIPFI